VSFYRDLGKGKYEATPRTAGPWSPDAQHAGPPSALLGHVMERHEPREGFRIARMTLEIPRPVPVGEVEVAVTIRHSSARTQLLEGEITAGGRPVMLARAWRIAASPADTPALRPAPGPPPVPTDPRKFTMAGAHLDGYLTAMEWRFVDGGGFDQLGPGAAWARQRIPLVADAEDTPLTRALTLADTNWAVGAELDYVRQFLINVDVTLALHRDPVGEWLYLRSDTGASPGGTGLAQGQLHDQSGECGRILQTLLVAARPAAPSDASVVPPR
jgi:hypothetical protein